MIREFEALVKIRDLFKRQYNELYDILYYYLLTYVEEDSMSNMLFKDECESVLGMSNHDEILNYIMNL